MFLAGQSCAPQTNHCWRASPDHERSVITGGAGSMVQHSLPLTHQTTDPEHGEHQVQLHQVTPGHHREDHWDWLHGGNIILDTIIYHTHQISSIVKLLCLISVIKIFSIYLINIYLKNDDGKELIFISIICRLFLPTNHLSTLLPIPTKTFLVWSYNDCLLIQRKFQIIKLKKN